MTYTTNTDLYVTDTDRNKNLTTNKELRKLVQYIFNTKVILIYNNTVVKLHTCFEEPELIRFGKEELKLDDLETIYFCLTEEGKAWHIGFNGKYFCDVLCKTSLALETLPKSLISSGALGDA